MHISTNPRQLQFIRRFARHRAKDNAARILNKMHPVEIAALFAELSNSEIPWVVEILFSLHLAAETLIELPEGILGEVLVVIDDERIAALIERLPMDDAVSIISLLDEDRSNEIVAKIELKKRLQLQSLLKYPENCAGSAMTPDYISLSAATTVEQAIGEIRRRGEEVETIFYLYVTDVENKLAGVVPIRQLVISYPELQLADLMVSDLVTVNVLDDRELAAQLVSKYNLLAIPVINDESILQGIITVDDIIDLIQESDTKDLYYMVGLSEDDRIFSPLKTSVIKRAPWLFASFIATLAAVMVIALFIESIQKVVSLAIFMPIVAAMGRHCGGQTFTVVSRGIVLGEIEFSSFKKALFKEQGVGLVIGLLLGIISSVVVAFFTQNFYLAVVLFFSMLLNISFAGLLSAFFPLLFHKLGKDPLLAGNIFVFALIDILGFALFLGFATLFLPYL